MCVALPFVKGKFGKTSGSQNILKYFESDCLHNIVLLFISLLTAPTVKSSHVEARIYVLFQKIVLKKFWKSFKTKCSAQWKDQKSSCQVRQI